MKALLTLLLAAASAGPQDHPKTYLISVIGLPIKHGEQMEHFSISTWGVEVQAVCKIPAGWRIKAGNSLSPDGVLEGEGSQGVTWFIRRSPTELRHIALVTLYAPIQRRDVRNGPDATFKGTATFWKDDGERKAELTYRNVRLTPARHCP